MSQTFRRLVSLDNGANATNNASGSATATLTGTAVGPDYGAALDTSGNTVSSGTEIKFGVIGGGINTHDELISNISNDAASDLATRMTITAEIVGDAASEFSFSLSDFFTGNIGSTSGPAAATLRNVVNGADLGKIAVQFVSKTSGIGTAQLRIRTDEESALGVTGAQVYVFSLIGGTAPEPGTIAVVATGLLGLVTACRRRGRTRAEEAAEPLAP